MIIAILIDDKSHVCILYIVYGLFANYLQVACHKAKIKEETHAGHQNQVFLMFFDELQIFMVLVHLHCVQSREIRICRLISSAVISHKRTFRQND